MKKRAIFNSVILTSLILAFWVAPVLAYDPYFFFYHQTESPIINGKSTYDNVNFGYAYVDITDTDPALENVTLTIKNGSYSFGTWDNLLNEQPIGVVTNDDFTFDTKYFSSNEAHVPVNNANERVYFWGAADSGFSEKAYSYTIGDLVTNGVLPKFRTTSEQLRSCVPYVEYVFNSNQLITALNVRFIHPSNPAQALVKTPAIDVELLARVGFEKWDGTSYHSVQINKTFADGEELKYQIPYNNPIDPDEIYGVVVRFGRNTSSDLYALYRWYFYTPDDAQPLPPTDNNTAGSGSGGGCDTTAASLVAFALGALLLSRKKR